MTTKEMRERRGKCAHDMAELAKNLTKDNKKQFDDLDAEQEGLRVQIEAIERASALDTELRGSTRLPQDPIGGETEEAREQIAKQKLAKAFRNYLKNGLFPDNYGFRGVEEEERKLM